MHCYYDDFTNIPSKQIWVLFESWYFDKQANEMVPAKGLVYVNLDHVYFVSKPQAGLVTLMLQTDRYCGKFVMTEGDS